MEEPFFDRQEALGRLAAETFDVVVVGAGATGAGVALDAASRGLTTALIERRDFASGTSSKSSKMAHGGLRYLQQGDVHLVRQALRERGTLVGNAPHLVRVLPFLVPMYARGGLIPKILAPLFRLALISYDLMGGARIATRHRKLDKEEALRHMPTLTADQLRFAYLYHDAQVDDARLTLTLARTAAEHGAAVANYVAVTGVLKDADGKATGVLADADGRTVEIRARGVVNASGVWADHTNALDTPEAPPAMRPARGVHVMVPGALVRNDVAVVLPAVGKGSVFAVPWGDFTYVGTTDTDYEGSFDDLFCNADDVAHLLRNLNANTDIEITAVEVVGSWAGLRPLLRGAKTKRTGDLSRRHRVTRSASGVVTVTGGKLTTYRQMAEDTVDEVVKGLGEDRRCRTKALPLHGAAGHDAVGEGGLGIRLRDHLVGRFGADAQEILDMVAADPELGQPVVPGLPYVRAEIRYAARHEMVNTLDDVFARRTRALLLGRDATADAAEEVAALVGEELGWSAEERSRQVAAYRALVDAERAQIAAPAPARAAAARQLSAGGWLPGAATSRRSGPRPPE
jgi:glycerol-3-phosphate dehydrogenase